MIPTQNELIPSKSEKSHAQAVEDVIIDTPYVDVYLKLLEQQKREAELQTALDDILTEVYDGDDRIEPVNLSSVDVDTIAENIDIDNTEKK